MKQNFKGENNGINSVTNLLGRGNKESPTKQNLVKKNESKKILKNIVKISLLSSMKDSNQKFKIIATL